MTMLADLAVAARKSGLRVVEVPGWKTRGRSPMAGGAPTGIAVHHTATSARAEGNYPTYNVILKGHGSLPGPLAQLGLGRDGTVYVFAAGRCNHAGKADDLAMSNSYSIGIEAEHPGVGSWPKVQYDAYVALCAALTEHYKLPVSRVRGHKEFAVPYGRKNDPNFSMPQMREDITALRNRGGEIANHVETPPRVPRYGHRGVPAKLAEDGLWGNRTHDALMWYVDGDRLTGLTRANVRDIQTWVSRPRTGVLSRDDVKAIQARVSAVQDGVWPRDKKSNTTLGIQRFLNRRLAENNKKGAIK